MISAWDKVTLARQAERPKTLDYINTIFDDFIELHGDRRYGDDKAIVGGIATLAGIPVTIIGEQKGKNVKENMERNFGMPQPEGYRKALRLMEQAEKFQRPGIPVTIIGEQKGKNVKENMERNFGMPQPEGYRKALRLMEQAEKFQRPIITFIDTPGAYPGMGAEERGQGEAIANNIMKMSRLKVPIICIVIGEGSSGGALAIGVGDKVVMLENAVYSILSPEGFATILYKDPSKAKEAAENMKITAKDLKKFNIIDEIIKEPENGAQNDFERIVDDIKQYLIDNIKKLQKISTKDLLKKRNEYNYKI